LRRRTNGAEPARQPALTPCAKRQFPDDVEAPVGRRVVDDDHVRASSTHQRLDARAETITTVVGDDDDVDLLLDHRVHARA
jgi:hypothetical protein